MKWKVACHLLLRGRWLSIRFAWKSVICVDVMEVSDLQGHP